MKSIIKKDTNRIAKVNSLIEHALGPILLERLDFQKGLVTISKVETSKDMKYAKVWISIFYSGKTPEPILPAKPTSGKKTKAPKTSDDIVLKYLADNIYHIQGEMNKSFATKIIPKISFHLDTSPRYVQHIDELIREVHKEES